MALICILQLVDIDATRIAQSSRKEFEDLGCGNGVAGDEQIVQGGLEADMNGHCAFGRRLVGVIRVNNLRNCSWQGL